MILGIRRGGSIGRAGIRRNGRRIEAIASPSEPRGETMREPQRSTLPVALEPAAERGRIVRLAPSVPFLVQLAVVHVDETGTPDRRSARRPDLVAPRASASYRGTERLSTEIEPGFLFKREF